MSVPTSAEWDIVSQLPGESWFAARLYYGNQDSYLSIGSKDFELDDEKFIGIISNKPAISGGFDIQTREYKIAGGTIEIINHIDQITTFGLLASNLGSGNDVGFENRRVDLRLMKEGISKFENGYALLQNGRMYRPHYGRSLVTIRVEDNTKNLMGTLGNLVTQSDATSGHSLPTQSAGSIKPIIYGDHRWKIDAGYDGNTLTKEEWDPTDEPRFVPMIDLGGDRWLVESDKVAGALSRDTSEAIWVFNSASGSWNQVNSYTVIQNNDDGFIIEIDIAGGPSGEDQYLYNQYDLPIRYEIIFGVGFFADPEFSIDGDVTTDMVITPLSTVGSAGIIRFWFPEISGSYIAALKTGELMLTGIGDFGSMNQLYVDGDLNAYYTASDLTLTFYEHSKAVDDAYGAFVDLTFRNSSGAAGISANITEVYRLALLATLRPIGSYLWGGFGHAILSWVDDASRSSHFNFGDAGDPAINPATCVESIARNDMGFVDDTLNKPSFDQASNDLSTSLANFDVRVETDFKLFLSHVSRQFRSIIGIDTNSKLGMIVINNRYSSADVVISYNDMAGLKFERTDDDQLTSKVIVEYSFNGDRYLNNTDKIENTTTRTRYGLSVEATSRSLKADLINDAADAEAYGDFELAFWQQHHNTIDEMSLDMAFMKYSPGDVIRIKDLPEELFPNGEDVTEVFTRAGQDILPYFLITDFVKSDRVIFKGIQMHDTTP